MEKRNTQEIRKAIYIHFLDISPVIFPINNGYLKNVTGWPYSNALPKDQWQRQ